MNDDIYIATMKEQINSGMYDHLFVGKRDLVFLDIGANIGLVSIYAVPHCNRIVAVEPSPETYQKLYKNTKDYVAVSTLEVALSPENQRIEFFVNDVNFTASSSVNTYGSKTMVYGYTLERILRETNLTHVDVCKIDAEGAEGESLSLLQLDLASHIIDTYFVEFHNCPKTTWEHKLGTTVANLARLGYHKQQINGMALTASK